MKTAGGDLPADIGSGGAVGYSLLGQIDGIGRAHMQPLAIKARTEEPAGFDRGIEQAAFGERNGTDEKQKGCDVPSLNALMMGLTMIGIFKLPLLKRSKELLPVRNKPAGYLGSALVGVSFGADSSIRPGFSSADSS